MLKISEVKFAMAKNKKRKSKLHINESLDKRLEAMDKNVAIEVLLPKSTPKSEIDCLFDEAIDKEENKFSSSKIKENKKQVVDSSYGDTKPWVYAVCVTFLLLFFILFILVSLNIISL